MADYYTETSFIVELPEEACDWLEALRAAGDGIEDDTDIAQLVADGELEDDEFAAVLKERQANVSWWNGIEVERESPTELWFHHDECANIDVCVELIQATLKKFDLSIAIGFEWANTCSKPRVDAYGGGAVVVTKNDSKYVNTGSWVSQTIQDMELELAESGSNATKSKEK